MRSGIKGVLEGRAVPPVGITTVPVVDLPELSGLVVGAGASVSTTTKGSETVWEAALK